VCAGACECGYTCMCMCVIMCVRVYLCCWPQKHVCVWISVVVSRLCFSYSGSCFARACRIYLIEYTERTCVCVCLCVWVSVCVCVCVLCDRALQRTLLVVLGCLTGLSHPSSQFHLNTSAIQHTFSSSLSLSPSHLRSLSRIHTHTQVSMQLDVGRTIPHTLSFLFRASKVLTLSLSPAPSFPPTLLPLRTHTNTRTLTRSDTQD